jgi:hypothetical protein
VAPRLAPFKAAIDEMLIADLSAPRKQRHTVRRVLARLVAEHDAGDLSYSTVRDYVAVRRAQLAAEAGRGRQEAFIVQTHRPGEEALCGKPHRASYAACGNVRRRCRLPLVLGTNLALTCGASDRVAAAGASCSS